MDSPPTPLHEDTPPAHEYDLRGAGLVPNLLGTVGMALGVGLLVTLFLKSPVAPGDSFLSDPDTTIIASKVVLARNSPSANLALVGDSSCLMDLDVATLESSCPLRVVNLGTLSYLGLDASGLLAGELLRGKEDPRVAVVVHPEALRVASRSPSHRATLDAALGSQSPSASAPRGTPASLLGFDEFQRRVADRWIPRPLKGALGNRYGFTADLHEALRARKGSMDEPGRFDPGAEPGTAGYRLAARIESECRRFRESVPPGTRIRVILAPVPQSHALPGSERILRELQSQLEGWLGAEGPSWNLPLVLPDAEFGSRTHLNPEGAQRYSRLVGAALCSWN